MRFSSTWPQLQVQRTLGGSRSQVYTARGERPEREVTFPVVTPRHSDEPRLKRRPRVTHFQRWLASPQDGDRMREWSRTPRHPRVPSWKKAKSSESSGAAEREREGESGHFKSRWRSTLNKLN